MAANSSPLIQLDPRGKAPILSYNVPEPATYSGRNHIGLHFDDGYFTAAAKSKPQRKQVNETAIRDALISGHFDQSLFPNVRISSNKLSFVDRPNNGLLDANRAVGVTEITHSLASKTIAESVSRVFKRIDPAAVASRFETGERLNIYRNMFGTYEYNFLPEPAAIRPRLLLVETYELSTHLGNYGAGRTLSTFTLLPGEKTTISIKTYKKTETEAKQASSILDSFTEESSSEFENSVQDENSDKRNSAESFEYHAEADAHASWGWGSANVSGGIKGGSNSSREEFSKNVSKATDKHAAKASAKRDVQIDTSFTAKEETGVETSIQRELQNINVGRTLNFVFRQMNQEFYTVLHLVDVRVAFFNGFAESKIEVPLSKLDELLGEVIVPERHEQVRRGIIEALSNISDYQDKLQSIVEKVSRFDGEKPYWRVRRDMVTEFKNPATGFKVNVLGIPVSSTRNVMRTDGIIVEALLGQGEALDDYSKALQEQAVRSKQIDNDRQQASVARENLAQAIVDAGDVTKAELFVEVFPPPPPQCCCHAGEEATAAPVSIPATPP